MNPTNTTQDPLARASATPDVAALITEFTSTINTPYANGPQSLAVLSAAENVRYNRWPGKSPSADGVRRQKDQANGVLVKPYNNRPDTEINLADELIEAFVDMEYFAWKMARIGANTTHVTQLTAAGIAELSAVVKWCITATQRDLRNGGELLSQIKWSIGWAVLHTGWREKWGLVERTVTMQEVFDAANQAYQQWQQMQQIGARRGAVQSTEPPPLTQLPAQIVDESLEAQAVGFVSELLPHLKKARVKQIVRDLRTGGEATFLDRQLEFKGPYLETLIPGVNFFVSGGTADLQKARGCLRIEFLYEAQVRAMAVDAQWNEEFIESVLGTGGDVTSQGQQLRANDKMDDSHERRIEIWHTEVLQYDEDLGSTGIYCTTFSPHLSPESEVRGQRSEVSKAFYARHYLLDSAHGQYPYVVDRCEVIGPALDDARGVPEKVRADSNQLKLHQDALAIRAQWEVNPAVVKTGSGWSKINEPIAPGADITIPFAGDAKPFALDRGNPAVGSAFMDRIEKSTRRRFALPNNGEDGSHPSLWQMRQARVTDRSLAAKEEAFLQLAILCYQEFSPEELGQIIGHPPRLTVNDLLRCQVELTFDSRSLDNDWRTATLDTFIKLLSIDNGGLIDRAPLIRVIGSMTDTTLMDDVMRSPAGAQAQLYRKVEGDIGSIMQGNPPPLVEMDATAGMQLQMAMAVIGKNQKFQQVLQQDQQVRENLKTYVENLQHSQQETELSPVQGRLGVAEMPQKPVSKGNAMQTAWGY